jgi:hypothetical protein
MKQHGNAEAVVQLAETLARLSAALEQLERNNAEVRRRLDIIPTSPVRRRRGADS